jgi:hypothetical protein
MLNIEVCLFQMSLFPVQWITYTLSWCNSKNLCSVCPCQKFALEGGSYFISFCILFTHVFNSISRLQIKFVSFKGNTTGVTSGADTSYPSEHLSSHPVLHQSINQSFIQSINQTINQLIFFSFFL